MAAWAKIADQFQDVYNMAAGILRSSWNDPDAWEASIRAFESRDRRLPPAPGMIVFVGSSSFTLWSTLEADMAPLPVLNRGFGGARLADVLHYAGRIVVAYRPRAVVLFAGTNDIAWPRPASPRQVYEGYLAVERCIRSSLPNRPLYFVAITPTIARWGYWHIVQEANRLICEHMRSDPCLHFIDLADRLLGTDGKPDRRLYRADGLHPNRKGYEQWIAILKPMLLAEMAS